jgi:large subunit ribosomal protein L10e
MARLRPAKCYRDLKRPFTRKSRYKKANYVGGVPGSKITIFDMGDKNKQFTYTVTLVNNDDALVRHNALESARITANKFLSIKVGKGNYHFRVLPYPHHVMREHALATGAGADRFSTGMAKSYGKSVGRAARVKAGQSIMSVWVEDNYIEPAKVALNKASQKLPGTSRITVTKNA